MEKMNNRYQSNEDLNTFRLTPMKRMYYALGDFGYNFMYYWLSTYLMIYYTDTIGIPAATVSVMMLVVRIFDAFNDPVIGSLADRTNSRWGRYRPWFMLGSIAMACFIVLIFAASPGWQMTSRLLWMWGIYLLLTVASTCSNMPYGALNGCITPDSEDRAKVSGLRMMFANVSSMVTVIIAVPLMIAFSSDGSASSARGYFWAVLITCILGLPTMIVSCCKTKEVLTPPPTQNKIPMNLQMKSLVKNKAVLILIIGQFILEILLRYSHPVHIHNKALVAPQESVSLQLLFHIVQFCVYPVLLSVFQKYQKHIPAALYVFNLPVGNPAAPASLFEQKCFLVSLVFLLQKTSEQGCRLLPVQGFDKVSVGIHIITLQGICRSSCQEHNGHMGRVPPQTAGSLHSQHAVHENIHKNKIKINGTVIVIIHHSFAAAVFCQCILVGYGRKKGAQETLYHIPF